MNDSSVGLLRLQKAVTTQHFDKKKPLKTKAPAR